MKKNKNKDDLSRLKNKSTLGQAKLAYSELRTYYDKVDDANSLLDNKFTFLISSLSIIISLFSFTGINDYKNLGKFQYFLLGSIGILIVLFFIFFILGFFPRQSSFPIDNSIDTIKNVFYSKASELDSYIQINKQYSHFIDKISQLNAYKFRYLKFSIYSYILILLLALLFIFTPIC